MSGMADPDRKARWFSGIAIAMPLSAFVGLLPIVYFSTIRRSAAALEYERLVRQGEQERARRERSR